MSKWLDSSRVLLFSAVALVSGCGVKLASHSNGGYARARVTDASMRQVLNQKWTCSHADHAADGALPYRKITLFNEGQTQSLQLAIHYADVEVPTVDLVEVTGLECSYSTADTRVVKCTHPQDPTFKLESTVARSSTQGNEVLSIILTGAESTYSVYFGGRQNRLATLAEFKQRYAHPFELRISTPETCGFSD